MRMRDFLSEFAGLLIMVVICLALIAGLLVVVYEISHQTCNDYAQLNPHYQFFWTWRLGCMIKLSNDFWVSTDQIQVINGRVQLAPDNVAP